MQLRVLLLATPLLTGCFEPNKAFWMGGRGQSAKAVLPHEQDPQKFYPHQE